MKLIGAPIVVTGVAVSVPIPVDSRSNPISIGVNIVDGGVSTYAVQYTLDDPYAVNAANVSIPPTHWFAVPGGATTGNGVVNVTVMCTAIRLSVSVGPATVTIQNVYQAESTQGA